MDLSLTPQEEKELQEMFFFESQERHQKLNELLTSLETDLENHLIIDDIQRITHTLKGNAMGMNQVGIADLAHVLEEVFESVNKGEVTLSKELFSLMYKLTDKIGQLINNLKEGKKISHKGIKTKIQVFLREAKKERGISSEPAQPTAAIDEPTPEAEEVQEVLGEVETEQQAEEQQVESQEEVLIPTNDDAEVESAHDAGKKPFFKRLFDVFRRDNKRDLGSVKESSNHQEDSTSETKELADETAVKEDVVIVDSTEETQPEVEQPPSATLSELSKAERPNLTVDDERSVLDILGNEDSSAENDLHKDLQGKVTMADMVQVPVRKLDALMNLVGQLIIERDRLLSNEELSRSRKSELAGLQRVTSDLQYSVMDVRLVQVGSLFSKFHRIARDVAHIENKEINLVVKGSDVEIDRNILQIISDSMVHLVRNAVGHGIEDAAGRERAGKSKVGTITLSARTEKDNVIIDVSDDGKGIDAQQIRKKILEKGLLNQDLLQQLTDEEVIMHIFETGFSNADRVSEVSGRGVGMDVVKKSTESIGGLVEVNTEVGKGTTISLKLPSSMAVKGVLMFMMGEQEFAIALPYTEAVVSLKKSKIRKAGSGLVSSYLDKTISVLFLEDLLGLDDLAQIYEQDVFHNTFDQFEEDDPFNVIIITYAGRYYGIVVDKLLQQKDIIEKPMPKPLDGNRLLSGTTIMGNGNVCLIIDAVAITDLLFTSKLKIQEHLKAS
ncbi:MAG: chemotaxis protein CheA [Ekhidna sp.]